MLFNKKKKIKQQSRLKQIIEAQDLEYEICVICGTVTNIPRTQPLETRSDYISGAGQLCRKCAMNNEREQQDAMRCGFIYPLPVYEKEGQ